MEAAALFAIRFQRINDLHHEEETVKKRLAVYHARTQSGRQRPLFSRPGLRHRHPAMFPSARVHQ
jgi:hypothetical protein